MVRRVTWRFWAVTVGLLAAYAVLGVFYASSGRVEADIYTWGLVAAAVMPLAFTAVTWLVTRGAWRQNDLGVNLVVCELGLVPFAGILAYVFLFQHGMLSTSQEAWVEIGSPWWTAFWLGWRNFIYLRMRREGNGHK